MIAFKAIDCTLFQRDYENSDSSDLETCAEVPGQQESRYLPNNLPRKDFSFLSYFVFLQFKVNAFLLMKGSLGPYTAFFISSESHNIKNLEMQEQVNI